MKFKKLDIIVVGVGGQGILTCSNIIARASIIAGLNVLTSEVHGMAQRGGSVEVHVRIGDVISPLIPIGDADVMLALEPAESLRYARYLNEKTTVIMNTRPLIPPSVTLGISKYPDVERIVEIIGTIAKDVRTINAYEIAKRVGSAQAANIVMIGALAKCVNLPFTIKEIEQAIREVLPEKLHDLNIKALKAGFDSI